MTTEEINSLFGVTESFQLPVALMATLTDREKRMALFDKFPKDDLTHDFFNTYFQEQHSNREQMMQDFTPPELCDVVANMTGNSIEKCLDVCAGTGGLTIATWKRHQTASFYVEELSERAFPILLFNLAIRNISGYAINKNVLTGEYIKGFRLTKGDKYSDIEQVSEEPERDVYDAVIMNPPYSLKHTWDTKQQDPRFEGYGYPPTKANDYAFVLHGLFHLKEKGVLIAVLPHGVLFRGNAEQTIRTKLIQNNLFSAVVGLPDKLFLNTQIPVCIMKLQRNSERVLFIDASKHFQKNAKLNQLRAEDVDLILNTVRTNSTVEKYSNVVGAKEIEQNDYNLNIPRYVDTYEPPPPIDMKSELADIDRINMEIAETEKSLMEMLSELRDNTGMVQKHVELMKHDRQLRITKQSKKEVKETNGQMSIFDIFGIN